jgi:hypothetical protein
MALSIIQEAKFEEIGERAVREALEWIDGPADNVTERREGLKIIIATLTAALAEVA